MRRFHPYSLLILGAAMVGLLILKINKQSFYHHYFRVIEEVETRNSQNIQSGLLAELSADEIEATAPRASMTSILSRITGYFRSNIHLSSWIFFPPKALSRYAAEIKPMVLSRLFVRFAAIHAP